MEITGVNPNTTFGFGTWVAFGTGRVPVGYDSGDTDFDTAEETGGAKTHQLTEAELASHVHSNTYALDDTDNTASSIDQSGARFQSTKDTEAAGGDTAHNNVQPYIVVHMWKRTAQEIVWLRDRKQLKFTHRRRD